MALIRISPVEARVRWDRAADRPSSVRWNGGNLEVSDLDAIRDERAAFPADRGPRITYVVRVADGSRASIVFDERRKRWYVEAIEQAA